MNIDPAQAASRQRLSLHKRQGFLVLHRRRAWKRVEQRGTVEAITRIGGVAIQSSALTVDASRVGPDGFVPSGTG